MNIFKPEQFKIFEGHIGTEFLSEFCNKILQKHLESCPVVFGYGETPMASSLWNMNHHESGREKHTHKAYLFGIEEIKPKCEKHEPIRSADTKGYVKDAMNVAVETTGICAHCGVHLIAEWKAK